MEWVLENSQLELFGQDSRLRGGEPNYDEATLVVCWTRMQAESGEQLEQIVGRKEIERDTGRGTFLWGIGNPIKFGRLSGKQVVPVYFSKMLSRPKAVDVSPSVVLVWRKFLDASGGYGDLPPHCLVTSKGHTPRGRKLFHFALVCKSSRRLRLLSGRPFDSDAYRNVGGEGRSVGFSQVTALVRQVRPEGRDTSYQIDMQANLVSPFVLKLADPGVLTPKHQEMLDSYTDGKAGWLSLVRQLRSEAIAANAA